MRPAALLLLVLLAAGLAAGPLLGQAAPDGPAARLASNIEAARQSVAELHWAGRIVLSLTLAVAILGLATSTLQSHRKAKQIAVVLGLTISTLTIVRTTVYKHDFHAYRSAARHAEGHLAAADYKMTLAPSPNDENWRAFVEEIDKEIVAIRGIADRLDSDEVAPVQTGSVTPESLLASPAWADPGLAAEPSWVKNPPPSTPTAFYFVGRGQGRTLEEAREAAARDSEEFLERFALEQFPTAAQTPEALSSYRALLLSSAIEEATSFSRDENSGAFQYARLLSVRREVLDTKFRFYAIGEKSAPPEQTLQSLRTSQNPSDSLVAKSRADTAEILSLTQQQLSPELWREFSDARFLRLKGDSAGAAEKLQRVVVARPDAYFAWFNLGLALDNQGRAEVAQTAYERALALESALPSRDPAIYNTLGHFFLRQGKNEEAIRLFKQALAIDPKHAKALHNLAVAEQPSASVK